MAVDLLAAKDTPSSPLPDGIKLDLPKDLLASKNENVSDAKKATDISPEIKNQKIIEAHNKILLAQGYDPDVDYGFDKFNPEPPPPKDHASLLNVPNVAKRAGGSLEKAFGEGGALKPRDPGSLSPEHIKEYLGTQWKELKKLPAQIALQRADNPQEAKLALEQIYGTNNVGQDKGGRWWAKINGKKQAIFGGGQGVKTGTEKFGTGIAASSPTLAGSALAEQYIGIPLAAETMGLSVPAAWMMGGMVGKGIDELAKTIQGVDKKTPEEETKTLLREGELNTTGNLLPKGIAMTAKGAANLIPKYMTKATTKGKEMVDELLSLGYRPPLTSAAPGLKAAQYDQALRNIVAGDPKAALNIAKIKHELIGVLRDSGVSDKDVYPLLKQLTEKTEALSSSGEGRAVTEVSKLYKEKLHKMAEGSLDFAKKLVDAGIAKYKKLASTAGPVAKETAEAVSQARSDVSEAYRLAYGHVDQMTEGKPFAPLWLLKNKIYEITKNMSPDTVPIIYKNILAMPDADISVMKMHDIRSKLWNESSTANLTPGAKEFYFGEAARMADASLRQAEKAMKGTQYEDAIPFMRKVDEGYGKALAPFKDNTINKLVQDMKTGLEPNPEVTANVIAENGKDARTKFILSTMAPEVRRKVGAAFMKGIFDDAERLAGSNEFMTSGKALLQSINSRGSSMDELYGPIYGKEFVGKLKEAAKQLAAIDGKLNVKKLEEAISTMNPGSVLDALNAHLSDLKKIDNFVKNDPLATLASDNPQVVDRALRTIVKPGDEATLAFAANALGTDSKEWKMIQGWAMKDLLSKAIHQTSTGSDIITGKALKDTLRQYTSAQQDLLFPKEIIGKLAKIADKADFLFPYVGDDFGGSLAGAQIKGGIPLNFHSDFRYLWLKFFGWLVDKPAMVDYLVNGLENPNLAERTKAEGLMQQLFKLSVVESDRGPGKGKAEDEK